MALGRREAMILGGVGAAAAVAGFLAGPRLLQLGAGDGGALREFAFEDLSGRARPFSEWKGRVLVLNFWATWCAPCREEIPMLMAIRDRYSSKGVEIVGIAIDLAAKVAEYVGNMRIQYPILIADSGGLDLMRKLGNTSGGLPYTVLVDRQGEIGRRRLGALKEPELEDMLSMLLRD